MKRDHNPGFSKCVCSKCGKEAVTKPGTKHRKCPSPDNRAPKAERGTWE